MKIKFRVWDTEEKRWAVQDYAIDSKGDLFYVDGSHYDIALVDASPDRYIVSLWTGLTDRAGHDVYAGDVVEWPHNWDRAIVCYGIYESALDFCEGTFVGWHLKDPKTGDSQALFAHLPCTVVGNIYEQEEVTDDAAG